MRGRHSPPLTPPQTTRLNINLPHAAIDTMPMISGASPHEEIMLRDIRYKIKYQSSCREGLILGPTPD
jgi:hypothetical protein